MLCIQGLYLHCLVHRTVPVMERSYEIRKLHSGRDWLGSSDEECNLQVLQLSKGKSLQYLVC